MGCMCKRCHGVMKLVGGALILMNAFLWPKWLGIDGWIKFFGLLMVVGGFVKLVMPNNCKGCAQMCGGEMSAAKTSKKR